MKLREEIEVSPIWGPEFIDAFIETGDRFSVDNDTLHLGFMLALLGQCVGDAKFYIGDDEEHCRVHPFMVQDSGSGKDPAFKFAKLVANMVDIQFSDSNDLTNAGLVGTFDNGEEVYGAADRYDIIGFREAMELLKSSNPDWSENFSENLNAILDGSPVERHMAAGTIEITPDCTVVGTTYPPSEKDIDVENMMRNGTLARFLYFFKEIPFEHRFEINGKLIGRIAEGTTREDRLARLNEIADTLSVIRDEIGFEEVTFEFDIDSERVTHEIRTMIESDLRSSGMKARHAIEPAITRYCIHTFRVACLMAALDECSTVVNDSHIDRALEIVGLSWSQMMGFFENYYSDEPSEGGLSNREMMIVIVHNSDQGVTQQEVADELGVTKRMVRTYAETLAERGVIEKDKDGRTRIYRKPETGNPG